MSVSHHTGRGLPITEKMIQETCAELLEWDGWRRIRTDLKHLRGLGVQEKGIADDLFIRYHVEAVRLHYRTVEETARTEAMWIEFKRIKPTGKATKASKHQAGWHLLERKRGALVLVAGEDFSASIEGFKEWYRHSGLMRKEFL